MEKIVNQPTGKLIRQSDGGSFELRWHDGHVYGFSREMTDPDDPDETPTPTGNWEVFDFGTPQNAKMVYPKLADRIDEVCI